MANRTLKILIDARQLGKKPSGIGMSIHSFVMEARKRDDIEIFLVSDIAESKEIQELQEYVRVFILGSYIKKNFSIINYMRFLKTIINTVKPDIFWEPNNLLPLPFKNPYGKYVVTINDVFPLSIPEAYSKIYKHYFRIGINNTLKSCDAILYISEYSKSETERLFKNAKNRQNIISYVIASNISKLNIERKDYYLYVGNLEIRKGTDILLKAFSSYVDNEGKKNLVLAGKIKDDEVKLLLDDVSQKTNQIKYLGYIDDETRSKLYNECGCFVFPSRGEGFGMPIIEALSCGAPVIASDLSVFHELVGECVKYVGVNENDLLWALLADKVEAFDEVQLKNSLEKLSPHVICDKIVSYFNYLIRE